MIKFLIFRFLCLYKQSNEENKIIKQKDWKYVNWNIKLEKARLTNPDQQLFKSKSSWDKARFDVEFDPSDELTRHWTSEYSNSL